MFTHRFAFFLLMPLAVGACSQSSQNESAVPSRAVSVAEVEAGTVFDTVEVIGELEGASEARVLPSVPEQIQRIHVREGTQVKKGQLLATLRGDLQAEATQQAEAVLRAAEANFESAVANLKRTRTLVEADAASRVQLENAETQHNASEAQVRQARAALSQAKTQRGRMTITSPIDGVVTHINAREGDFASPNLPLMTVVSSQRLRAVFDVPERHFGRLKRDMEVRLQPLANSDVVVEAKITNLSPAIDRATRTGLVEAAVDNQERKLLPGGAVRAIIVLDQRDDINLVPAEAVIFRTETASTRKADLFVADNGVAKRREVTVGQREGNRMEIASGVNLGELVVVRGAHLLRDENPIEIVGRKDVSKEN